jgi:hypothetical protein
VICPGPVFNELRSYLYDKEFNFRVQPIGGDLQALMERSFASI